MFENRRQSAVEMIDIGPQKAGSFDLFAWLLVHRVQKTQHQGLRPGRKHGLAPAFLADV